MKKYLAKAVSLFLGILLCFPVSGIPVRANGGSDLPDWLTEETMPDWLTEGETDKTERKSGATGMRLEGIVKEDKTGRAEYTLSYDSMGRLVQVFCSWDSHSEIGYNFVYDDQDRLVEEYLTDWDIPSRRYVYDSEGKLAEEENQGTLESFSYDSSGRLVKSVFEHNTGTAYRTYRYDGAGKLTEMEERNEVEDGSRKNTTYSYWYDEEGRTSQVRVNPEDGDSWYFTYRYDIKPFVVETYWWGFTPEACLQLCTQGDVVLWSLAGLYEPEFITDDDGYVTQVYAGDWKGEPITVTFRYEMN